ncbi:hypothetical protein ADL07_11445 [Streptomyces sp. NRRL F-4707]|uniref:hypothetical protein n=1 Tax=Streptomyces sp. NRRL F-4707 TaxID=1519496 RepID=UPI0006C17404|nr:hypothetical protein [Streptomyces sp. NRRL F-4707]KOX32784.1 hypothetical protein ADL07_11445 [Streptomyces sp. NRRL F-4707]
MARTGPQRYPGASTAYWYGSKYPGSAMESNVVVWHTTEGTSLPSYDGGSSAPNFTAKPDFAAKRLVWYQHFDFDVSSRALVNRSGGVETNTLNVVQVEIVGTCDPATHKKWGGTPHLYTPDLPDWAIRDLAEFAKWAHEQHGIPLTSGVTFKAYPSSYGNSSVRMSNTAWSNYRGHCGHQHVPENDHGDPGLLPMAAILTRAAGKTTPPPEDDVSLTSAQAKQLSDIAAKVNTIVDSRRIAPWQYKGTNEPQDAYAYLRGTKNQVDALNKKVDALKSVDLTDEQIAKLADKVAAAPGLADAIAEKVAQKIADRLAE